MVGAVAALSVTCAVVGLVRGDAVVAVDLVLPISAPGEAPSRRKTRSVLDEGPMTIFPMKRIERRTTIASPGCRCIRKEDKPDTYGRAVK